MLTEPSSRPYRRTSPSAVCAQPRRESGTVAGGASAPSATTLEIGFPQNEAPLPPPPAAPLRPGVCEVRLGLAAGGKSGGESRRSTASSRRVFRRARRTETELPNLYQTRRRLAAFETSCGSVSTCASWRIPVVVGYAAARFRGDEAGCGARHVDQRPSGIGLSARRKAIAGSAAVTAASSSTSAAPAS